MIYGKGKGKEVEVIHNYEIYLFFLKYRFLSYKRFCEKLKKYLNIKNICPSLIRKKINYVKDNISYMYAEDMEAIFNYMLAVRDKNHDEILRLYPIIKNIENPEPGSIMKPNFTSSVAITKVPAKQIDNIRKVYERRIDEVNIVINENKTLEELVDEGKISSTNIKTDITKVLNDIECEKYIKFLIIVKNLHPISYTELCQYIDVLEYFCKNLNKKIEILNNLHSEEEIREFYVEGEEDLKNQNVSRLKNWKLQRLLRLKNSYDNLLDKLNNLKNKMNLDEFTEIDTFSKNIIKKDSQFIHDYYVEIAKISREYKKINSIKTAADKKICEIKDEYNKQLILRDNS